MDKSAGLFKCRILLITSLLILYKLVLRVQFVELNLLGLCWSFSYQVEIFIEAVQSYKTHVWFIDALAITAFDTSCFENVGIVA